MRVFAASVALALAGLTVSSGPADAHHSSAMFDKTRVESVEGTVKVFEWTNPHAWLWIVRNTPSGSQQIGFEMGALGILRRQGWTQREFMPGDKVKVSYNPLHDGRPGGLFVEATFANGDKVGSKSARVKAGS